MKTTELVVEGSKIFYYISSNSHHYLNNLQGNLVLKHTFINLVDLQFNLIAVHSFQVGQCLSNFCQLTIPTLQV